MGGRGGGDGGKEGGEGGEEGESSRKQSSGGTMRTVYSYNNVDAGFARFTMLSSNFLNQLNLLLLELIQKLLRANSLAVRLKTARGTQRFHRPVNGYPNVRSCCDVTYTCEAM